MDSATIRTRVTLQGKTITTTLLIVMMILNSFRVSNLVRLMFECLVIFKSKSDLSIRANFQESIAI